MAELIGLQTARKVVSNILSQERPVQAVLFFGSDGSGKDEIALQLAKGWLCTSSSNKPCGECTSCTSFDRGNNVDFLHITPQPPSNIIRLEAIYPKEGKEVDQPSTQEFLRTQPLSSPNKIVLISDADRMNNDAANALLKTLEEPPPYARLILTTTAIGLLPATIVSRCVSVACELPTAEEIQKLAPDLNPDEIAWAQGSPGLLDEVREHRELYASIRAFADGLSSRTPREALVMSEQFRNICEQLEETKSCGMRSAQGEALKLLGIALMQSENLNPEWPSYVVEAHRRIQGNGYGPLVLDTLFTKIATD